jgi:drug/metabolite transporter (DMT)-like permease
MPRWRIYLGLSLAIIFWGASFIASKIALRAMVPASITVLRFGIGLSLITLILLFQGKGKLVKVKEIPMLVLLGFLGVAFHQWLQVTGLKTAAATTGSWIVAIIPVFVSILGWLVLKERIGKKRIIGIVIASLGALAVVSQGNPMNLISGDVGTVGDALFLLSAINWAIFTVLSRRVRSRDPGSGGEIPPSSDKQTSDQVNQPLNTMMFVMAFGWFFSLIWFAADGRISDFSNLTGEYLWAILFLGVASSGLAYIFWYQALGVVNATQTGVFLFFEPIVTALLAWPILGESMSSGAIVGGIAILFGVWVVNRS